MNRAFTGAAACTLLATTAFVSAADVEWPGYNRTLTSDRYSELREIDKANVPNLKVTCTFDTGSKTSFQTGLVEVGGLLYGTTESDSFALDPATCVQKWRVHEDYKAASPVKVNRGVAYLDGRLFRGTEDGRVLCYEAETGKRVWETRIADPKAGETVPAAPIAWHGLVFVGNAGGDNKGTKGRIYALDSATGKIVWEFYLVPKDRSEARAMGWENADDVRVTGGATWSSYTLDPISGLLYVPVGNPGPDFDHSLRPGANLYTGSVVALDARTGAYRKHYSIDPGDYHDWDISTAPELLTTKAGNRLLAVAPKDGYLHAFDLASGAKVYATAVTKIENAQTPFSPEPVHFCPGTQGGSEWNGPAYSPVSNLIFTGAIEWCTTVALHSAQRTRKVADGKPWTGNRAINPKNIYGKLDPKSAWAGWVYAVDADSGTIAWKFKAPYPVMSGITPTAGGLVFVGDMGGNLYAFDSESGHVLWFQKIGGAIGGGVITYRAGGAQRIAVATGMTSPIWPTEKTTAKVVVLGLSGPVGSPVG